MRIDRPKLLLWLIIFGGAFSALLLYCNHRNIGRELDSYRGVPVYDNGLIFFRSHGNNYAPDGYYFGQKWQCVEFIKRFFYEAKGHKMPDVMGNTNSFFDPGLPDEALNARRQLVQFRNGSAHEPRQDDLLVFNDTRFGHVGIVTQVGAGSLEIIQQSVLFHTRQTFSLVTSNGHYFVTSPRKPAGWLRK